MDCIREVKPVISNYNIYGQIVYKKQNVVNISIDFCVQMMRSMVAPCNGMKRDLTEFNPNYYFDQESFFDNVKKMKFRILY